MIIKSQLATLLTSVSLDKTPQTIQAHAPVQGTPDLQLLQHTRIQSRTPGRWGRGDEIRFRERSLIEGSESIAGLGRHETRE